MIDFGSRTMTPHKFAVITTATREVLENPGNAEKFIGLALRETAAVTIDSLLFDTNAATADRPAGLLAGVGDVGATAGGTNDAMFTDLGKLANVVAPLGGTSIALVAAPREALKILLRAPQLTIPVLASGALTAGVVVAVALPALVVALDRPQIEISREGTLHMDTVPLAIGTAGAPATVAAPSRSLWQADTVGLKIRADISWGLRATTGAVAMVTGVTW